MARKAKIADYIFWLEKPKWDPVEASILLSGFEIEEFPEGKFTLVELLEEGDGIHRLIIESINSKEMPVTCTPAEWIDWAKQAGLPLPDALLQATNAQSNVSSRKTVNAENPCGAFRAITNLIADEINITFVGDKDETGMGANNMLEISARNITKRVALAELDLVNRNTKQLTMQGAILLGLARESFIPPFSRDNKDNTMAVKRLRDVLKKHLGISSNPFHTKHKSIGWTPRFKVTDNLGAADKRAKREAEHPSRTKSYEQMIEEGIQFSGTDEFGVPESDIGSEFFRNNKGK
jgi:hypothetical protein